MFMKKLRNKKTIVAVLSLIAVTSSSVNASWVDDWMSEAQTNTTSPGYYAGQQRGYVTGGSLSLRLPRSGTTYPFSFQAPAMKTGCGGIDLNLGAFSYLNLDVLVDKMQKILAAAPAAAFDMALNTLCTPCAQTMKALDSLANQVNGLQINDCQASKALVGFVADKMTPGDWAKEHGLTAATEQMASDTDTWWQGVKKKADAVYDVDWGKWWQDMSTTKGSQTPLADGCTADVKNFLNNPASQLSFNNSLGNTQQMTSVLKSIGEIKLGLPAEMVEITRGLVGDVAIGNEANAYKAVSVAPCSQNKDYINGITNAELYKNPGLSPEQCVKVTGANSDLRKFVTDRLTAVATKMKDKEAITPGSSEWNFINNSPIGIAYVLKLAIGTSQEGPMIANVADITAKAYSYSMLTDLLYRTQQILYMAKAKVSDDGLSKGKSCTITAEQSTKEALNDLVQRLQVLFKTAYEDYSRSVQDYLVVVNLADHFKQINEQLTRELSNRFSASLASRIVK